jgi:hypothetical protein
VVRGPLLVSVLLTFALMTAMPAASAPVSTAGYYTVRPDPRLCPSPLCGGYWAALANHARTVCADGLRRPRCYVAAVLGAQGPLQTGVPPVGLARGRLEAREFGGAGQLGVLVSVSTFAAAGGGAPSGTFARLVDNGIRCIRAPCFSLERSRLNSEQHATVSALDLTAAALTTDEAARANAALTSGGVLAQGRTVPESDGGRTFRATRVFLRAPPPRA